MEYSALHRSKVLTLESTGKALKVQMPEPQPGAIKSEYLKGQGIVSKYKRYFVKYLALFPDLSPHDSKVQPKLRTIGFLYFGTVGSNSV